MGTRLLWWGDRNILNLVCSELHKSVNLLRHIGFLGSSVDKDFTCNAGDPSSIPGLERSHGEGIGYPLQYSWASLWLRWLRICLWRKRPEFNPRVGKILWRWAWQPTPIVLPRESPLQYSCLENFGRITKKATVWSSGHQPLGFRQGIISRL